MSAINFMRAGIRLPLRIAPMVIQPLNSEKKLIASMTGTPMALLQLLTSSMRTNGLSQRIGTTKPN